jgi:hypothetical protein
LVTVDIPEELMLPVTFPVKFPVTFPVKFPEKPLVAVATPVTTTPEALVSNAAEFTSPVKSPVTLPVTFPEKPPDAVTIPVEFTLPTLSGVRVPTDVREELTTP